MRTARNVTRRLHRATTRSTHVANAARPFALKSLQHVSLAPQSTLQLPTHTRLYSAVAETSETASADTNAIDIGDQVSIAVDATFETGEQFVKAEAKDPFTFVAGTGNVIRGIDEMVVGLKVGEGKSDVIIEPEKAFGVVKKSYNVPKEELHLSDEDKKNLKEGDVIRMPKGETAHILSVSDESYRIYDSSQHPSAGQWLQMPKDQHARVLRVDDDSVEVDASHPHAGKTVYANFKVVDRVDRVDDVADVPSDQRLVKAQEVSPGDRVNYPRYGNVVEIKYEVKDAKTMKVLDSSDWNVKQPYRFQLGKKQVIAGLDEGLMQMSKGMKARLDIPAHKAYGDKGHGEVVPPNTDLVYEVELLNIIRF